MLRPLKRRFATLLSLTSASFALAAPGCGPADDFSPDGELGTSADALIRKCGAPKDGPVQGYDVSVYQGNFDWAAAKARGRVFGIARVSNGTGIIDETFPRNWAEMKKHGFIRGGYQYFRPGQDAAAQAKLMIDKLGRLGPGDLPAMIDVEQTDGQSPATIVAKVKTWMQLVEAGTGKRPIIYTGAYFWQDQVGDDKSLGDYPLVIPNYTSTDCPLLPGGWTDWLIWQYSDGNNKLDHDVFNGSLADLHRFVGLLPSYPRAPRRTASDLNGDGRADLCARAIRGIECKLSNGAGFPTTIEGPAWSDAAGWSRPEYASTISYGDVNGDGKADVCGRDEDGIVCALSDGERFAPEFRGPAWGDAEGWAAAKHYETIQLVDVNGDGKDDVCGRGPSGIVCALSDGSGFPTEIAGPAWTDAAGFDDEARYATIQFADVDGDGKKDVCARVEAGIECWLSSGEGFPTVVKGPRWTDEDGWSKAAYGSTVRFGDIDGDGRDDVCARGPKGIACARSSGAAFGEEIAGPGWGDAEGWAVERHYTTIQLADVNGDGKQDICGRAAKEMVCYLSDGQGFPTRITGPAWSDETGWNASKHHSTIAFGDVNHDGKDDVCGRGPGGMECALSTGDGFGPLLEIPTWSDEAGWGVAPYYGSIHLLGHAATPRAGGAPPGGGDGPPGSGEEAGVVDAEGEVEAGCAVRPGAGRGGSGALVLALAGALAASRRRRRSAT